MSGIWRARAGLLTLVGVLAVHYGRYAFATPEYEHSMSGAHGYLTWVAAAVGIALFFGVVQLAAVVARASGGAPDLPRGRTIWWIGTSSILTVFAAQECAEQVLSHGHLPSLVELLSAGGWTAIPMALAAGAAMALLLRGAVRVVRWALARSPRRVRRIASVRRPVAPVLAVPRSALARRLAGRAPPVLSLS